MSVITHTSRVPLTVDEGDVDQISSELDSLHLILPTTPLIAADPPRVPVEVAERIIDLLSDHVDTLRSCALTCHGWLPRARYQLMTSIRIGSNEYVSSMDDYFISHPRIAEAVRSVSVYIVEKPQFLNAFPVILLSRLPNLCTYKYSDYRSYKCIWHHHAASLRGIRTYLRVQELDLFHVRFRTGADLAPLLISFPLLRILRIELVSVSDLQDHGGDLSRMARFRDKCSQLSELEIHRAGESPGFLGLIVSMCSSPLEILRYQIYFGGEEELDLRVFSESESKRPHSVEFSTVHDDDDITDFVEGITSFLKFPLRHLTITFTGLQDTSDFDGEGVVRGCQQLEEAILTHKIPRLTISLPSAKQNRLALWLRTIQQRFPRLHGGGKLEICCSCEDLGHDWPVMAIAASPDGRYFATGARDGTIIIWSTIAYPQKSLIEISSSFGRMSTLAFSDTGDFLAAIHTDDHDVLTVWRVVDGSQLISTEDIKQTHIQSCVWWRDDLDCVYLSALAFSSFSHKVSEPLPVQLLFTSVYDTGNLITSLILLKSAFFAESNSSMYPHGTKVYAVMSSNGSLAAVVPRKVHSKLGCRVWHTADLTTLYRLTISSDVAPSSATFVGDTLVIGFEDGTIQWWDLSSFPLATTGPPGGTLTVRDNRKGVSALSASPAGSFLAAWSYYHHSVILLRRHCGDFFPHISLQGHTNQVNAACFSPCERYIATASNDATVHLWSVTDGSLIWRFTDHSAEVRHVVFSGDGSTLASADEEGRVCLHPVSRFVRSDMPRASLTD
ncbi:WD40 repeat-like protein [Lentinus tigrinus ALCF2SS1-7]|uniref:WD40 repeat-like protein n=1 Tax=Lentinus tigrinus ALCF2SS1-6 TaxID=1328759 RepID=A0A5C2S0F4_9APHY|nr:WD40 repeat-like protein [Lentinus tigrinus ALCF2SS1-6]RPD71546.1 WD40 repeat-like protein [Lentinus tigrinus ALCF2SS1-7]